MMNIRIAFAILGAVFLSGCSVIDPPPAGSLSRIPPLTLVDVPPADDSFSALSLPYPAARTSERSFVPVGDFLRSGFKVIAPNSKVTIRKWDAKAEVKPSFFTSRVVIHLSYEVAIEEDSLQHILSDQITSDIGLLKVTHASITGLHSVDSREQSKFIHDEMRAFLESVLERVGSRLREKKAT